MVILAALAGSALGLGLLGSTGLLILWALWELLSAPFRRDDA